MVINKNKLNFILAHFCVLSAETNIHGTQKVSTLTMRARRVLKQCDRKVVL